MANAGTSALSGAATGAALGSAIPGIGTAVGAGVGGLVGLAGSLFGAHSENKATRQNMQLQSKLNKEEMAYSTGLNQNYQNFLWQNQYGAQVSGMKNAGLNPASANTSLAGASTGNSQATGPAGPKGASMQLNSVGDALAGAKLTKELDLLDSERQKNESEANRNDALADESRVKSTPEYRQLLYAGMSEQNALTVAKAAEAHSNVSLNMQKVKESIQNVEESLSRISLNSELKNKAIADTLEVGYKIAERVQNMKESDARIELHRASASCQRSLANLHDKAAAGQDITNKDLERWYNAKDSILSPEYGSDGKPTGRYKSYWGRKAVNETIQGSVESDMRQYLYEQLNSMTPEERQKYLINLDGVNALTRMFSFSLSTK